LQKWVINCHYLSVLPEYLTIYEQRHYVKAFLKSFHSKNIDGI